MPPLQGSFFEISQPRAHARGYSLAPLQGSIFAARLRGLTPGAILWRPYFGAENSCAVTLFYDLQEVDLQIDLELDADLDPHFDLDLDAD